MFVKKKQVKNADKDNFLLFIPHIKHTEWLDQKEGVVLVFHHRHPVQRVANWLVKKPSTSDMTLDQLGSTVWKQIDGKRSILEIGELVRKQFGESCEPVYERLVMFLRYLNRRGWIYFENPTGQNKE